MDSPLLPTFKHGTNSELDTTNPLSDLSLSDDPLSPSESFAHAQSSRPRRVNGASPEMAQEELDDGHARNGPAAGGSKPRFSFFPKPQAGPSTGLSSRTTNRTLKNGEEKEDAKESEVEPGQDGGGAVDDPGQTGAQIIRRSSAGRDEKLRESLYELRKMNEVFDGFLGALEAARGHNLRLQNRVRETHELLDRYTALLGQTEHSQSLILNPNWTGAEDDFAAEEAEEKARVDAEEAAAIEAERKAEATRLAEERKALAVQDAGQRKDLASLGRGRGRGGTRIPSRGRGSASSRVPSSRSTSAASTDTSTGIRKPSDGLGGKYANVRSSGYGPTRKPV